MIQVTPKIWTINHIRPNASFRSPLRKCWCFRQSAFWVSCPFFSFPWSARSRVSLNNKMITGQELAIFAPESADCMPMPGFIEVLRFLLRPSANLFISQASFALCLHFFEPAFLHNLLYSPFHHPKVLLGIHMLRLRLVLYVVNFMYVALFLLITLEAVVDACWRPGGLIQ